MTTLADAAAMGRAEQGLAVVSTLRADETIQSTLVNAGVLPHPFGDQDVLAFVTYGAVKLANLRARPQVAVTFRSGWRFATVEGRATLLGPADGEIEPSGCGCCCATSSPPPAAQHDDWDE